MLMPYPASPYETQQKAFVFVGDKKTGKSSLILKLLDIQLTEEVKETTALDFQFGYQYHEDQKVRVNTYELGGGRLFSNLL